MCTFMALETIQYYKTHGSKVYLNLLDCTKAFDFVRFSKNVQYLNKIEYVSTDPTTANYYVYEF